MKRRHASVALVALLLLGLAAPHALAGPVVARPLEAAAPAATTPGTCFGYNGVNDSYIPGIVGSLRIALIQPVLTSTPYSQYDTGSFYAFYAKEAGVTTNVTTNLDLLSTNVSSGYGYNQGWGLSFGEYQFFTSQAAVNCGLQVGKNVQILTDMQVADGALFNPQDDSPRFDVVVLPFSEYVEASEYLAYEDFVGDGGTIVMMGHSLEYPVTYNATTGIETLVYGHNWANHGTYASPIACGSNTYVASCPWAKNNTDWIGSNTCEASCFHTYVFNGSVVNPSNPIGKALYDEFGSVVMKSYLEHEEDTVMNRTDTQIVAVFANDSRNLIAPYTHQFRKGTVVCFDIFGDDIIGTDPSAQYFMLQGMVLGRGGPSASLGSSTTTSTSSSTSLSSQASSTSALTSSVAAPSSSTASQSPMTQSSTLGQTITPTAVATSASPGALPSVLVALGGVAAVVIAAGAVVFRKREVRPDG
ncbi:MAG: hypothetical protein OK442_02170 [Thaumarchaeota archaeon]|nr:hypothetical protein [Nitrososphaerota archaeon]